jgi:hypothetical protein
MEIRGQGKVKVNTNPVYQKILFALKSQISSTKLQINLKFQYSMTKTGTTVASNRFTNPGLPVMMPLSKTLEVFLVWNFEFESLGFV